MNPRDVIALKPCPFCGGEADHIEGSRIVECVTCHGGFYEGSEAEAIAAWNRRAEPASGHTIVGPADMEAEDLDSRMKAAGMIPLSDLLAGNTPLEKWMAHTSVRDLDTFEAWLMMKHREFMTMRMGYELGDKDQSDELFEWVFAHSAAFGEVVSNFRAMKERSAAAPKPAALTQEKTAEGGEVMSFEWVRKNYNVPAKRGGRIEYTGGRKPELGTITSASGGRLNIRLDSAKRSVPFHPTWELRYLEGDTQ